MDKKKEDKKKKNNKSRQKREKMVYYFTDYIHADELSYPSAIWKSNRCLIHSYEYLMYRYFTILPQPDFSMDHSQMFQRNMLFYDCWH